VVDRGRTSTRRPVATLTFTQLLDPDPAGFPGAASGVAEVSVAGTPVRPGTSTVRVPLGGPDGRRSLPWVVHDRAGNVVSGSARIVLDTTAPAVRLRRTVVIAPAGAVAGYGATADDPGDDGSGTAPDTFRWRFGDGLPGGVTAAPTHVPARRRVLRRRHRP
jgi:hypothetical protein